MTGLNGTGTSAAAAAAGMITVTGGVLGMHYDALIMGFLGGLAWISYVPPKHDPAHPIFVFLKAAGTLFTSTIAAGAFASILAAVAVKNVSGVDTVDQLLVRSASAFAIGLLVHAGLPIFLTFLRGKAQPSN